MSGLGGLREQNAWGLSRSFGRAERTSAQKDKILGLERRSGAQNRAQSGFARAVQSAWPYFCARGGERLRPQARASEQPGKARLLSSSQA